MFAFGNGEWACTSASCVPSCQEQLENWAKQILFEDLED